LVYRVDLPSSQFRREPAPFGGLTVTGAMHPTSGDRGALRNISSAGCLPSALSRRLERGIPRSWHPSRHGRFHVKAGMDPSWFGGRLETMSRLVGLRCCPPWPSSFAVTNDAAFEDHRLGCVHPVWGCAPDPPDLHAGFPDMIRSCGSSSGLDTTPTRQGFPRRVRIARSSELSLLGLSKDPLRRIGRRGVHSWRSRAV